MAIKQSSRGRFRRWWRLRGSKMAKGVHLHAKTTTKFLVTAAVGAVGLLLCGDAHVMEGGAAKWRTDVRAMADIRMEGKTSSDAVATSSLCATTNTTSQPMKPGAVMQNSGTRTTWEGKRHRNSLVKSCVHEQEASSERRRQQRLDIPKRRVNSLTAKFECSVNTDSNSVSRLSKTNTKSGNGQDSTKQLHFQGAEMSSKVKSKSLIIQPSPPKTENVKIPIELILNDKFHTGRIVKQRRDHIYWDTSTSIQLRLSKIMRGYTSTVYQASIGDKKVAVKVLDKTCPERVHLCEELSMGLIHQNICSPFAEIEFDNCKAFLMPYCEQDAYDFSVGKDYANGKYHCARFDICIQLLDALEYIHKEGFVHLDLKPENVFLVKIPNGSEEEKIHVMLGDFGFLRQPSDNALDGRCGTVGYMSPEMLLHRTPRVKSDIFSAGAFMNAIFSLTEGSTLAMENINYDLNRLSSRDKQQKIFKTLGDLYSKNIYGLKQNFFQFPESIWNVITRAIDMAWSREHSLEEIKQVLMEARRMWVDQKEVRSESTSLDSVHT